MSRVPFSFELHPPRTPRVAQELPGRIARLVATRPEFVSVTYGAGGSSQDASLDVLKHVIAAHPSVHAMAHLTCVGSTVQQVSDTVRAFLDAGVRSFLAVRGDLPKDAPAGSPIGELRTGAELVQLIHRIQAERAPWREVPTPGLTGVSVHLDSAEKVLIAVAAFPNGHPSSSSPRQDIDTLLAKQAAGAELAITQLFFHAEDYFRLVDRARAAGVEIPILPGIMPVTSPARLKRMLELSGDEHDVPADLAVALDVEPSDEGRREIGVDHAVRLAERLLAGGAPGIHLYTLNQHQAPLAVLARAGLLEIVPQARVGTVSWKKPQWRGSFYPERLPQDQELAYAAERMRTLEVDTTFYGLQPPAVFRRWHDEVPDDFAFSVKGIRAVTHEHRLEGAARAVAAFLASGVLLLEEKLGAVLWQLPPSLPFQPRRMDAFLAGLPRTVDEVRRFAARQGFDIGGDQARLEDRRIRYALEARHHSFGNNPAFLELLERHGVAVAVTNSPQWPTIDAVTADFVYARLHADMTQFPGGYDDDALDRWAERVRSWLGGAATADGVGRDVFVYFDNSGSAGTRSPFDAIRLQGRLGGLLRRPEVTQQTALF